MNLTHYGIFDKYDTFVNLGTWTDEQDAHIAISEHGLDMELGEEYYVAPVITVQVDAYTIGYEPGEIFEPCSYCGNSTNPNDICSACFTSMEGATS